MGVFQAPFVIPPPHTSLKISFEFTFLPNVTACLFTQRASVSSLCGPLRGSCALLAEGFGASTRLVNEEWHQRSRVSVSGRARGYILSLAACDVFYCASAARTDVCPEPLFRQSSSPAHQ